MVTNFPLAEQIMFFFYELNKFLNISTDIHVNKTRLRYSFVLLST